METWMIVGLVVACWWVLGVAGMCCDWLDSFGEIDLSTALLIVTLFWIAGPVYLLVPLFSRMTGFRRWGRIVVLRGKGCWK